MKVQVEFLKSMGITTEFIGEDQRNERPKKLLKDGDDCQVVLGPTNSNQTIESCRVHQHVFLKIDVLSSCLSNKRLHKCYAFFMRHISFVWLVIIGFRCSRSNG